jgi:microcystin-dependent protein
MGTAVLWPLSMTHIVDINGKPYIGAKAKFYEGTTNADIISGPWTDVEMAVAHPNPVLTNALGMWPVVFLENDNTHQFYGLRITDGIGAGDGSVLMAKTVLPIGGPPPKTTEDIPVGDMVVGDLQSSYQTGPRDGFVRANGKTISKNGSGGTELADDDCQDLFELLWNANLDHFEVTGGGGRGATAADDWSAGKQIALPDLRGRVLVGRNSMGAPASGALSSDALANTGDEDYNGTPNNDMGIDTIGSHGGKDYVTLTIEEMPSHRHSLDPDDDTPEDPVVAELDATIEGGILSGGSAHRHRYDTWQEVGAASGGSGGSHVDKTNLKEWYTDVDGAHTHTHDLEIDATLNLVMSHKGGEPGTMNTRKHQNMPPFGIVTYYIKL